MANDQPGDYKGRHHSRYTEEIGDLKRANKHKEAAELLCHLVEAVEAEAEANCRGVAPWVYHQLAIVYRKLKDAESERSLLIRFAEQAHAPGSKPPKLIERLHKIGISEKEWQSICERNQARTAVVKKAQFES